MTTPTMTTKKARAALGVRSDYALALALGIKPQAVYAWKGKLPPARVWQVQNIVAGVGRKD